MKLPYYIADCGQRGSGVFAGKTFLAGEFILRFTGPLSRFEEIMDFTHFLQVSPDEFMGPSGLADDFVNHSCDPNCAVYLENNGPVLRAMRVILPDEELVFDYGTIMFSEPTAFDCFCGSPRCRIRVGGFNTMPVAMQEHYLAINVVPLLSRYSPQELGIRPDKQAAGELVNTGDRRHSLMPAE